MEFARAVLASVYILGTVAVVAPSECVAQLWGGNYFGLIHKNFGSLSPPHCSLDTVQCPCSNKPCLYDNFGNVSQEGDSLSVLLYSSLITINACSWNPPKMFREDTLQ